MEIEWDEQYVEPGMGSRTRELLKKSNWNPEVHRQGGWREDLNTLRESVQI